MYLIHRMIPYIWNYSCPRSADEQTIGNILKQVAACFHHLCKLLSPDSPSVLRANQWPDGSITGKVQSSVPRDTLKRAREDLMGVTDLMSVFQTDWLTAE